MKKRYLITAAAVIFLCITAGQVQAQKVYKEGTAIVLDCGPGSGFPQKSVETVKGKKVIIPSVNANGANNKENGIINKTVYKKLEIAAEDEIPSGTNGCIDWITAYTTCTGKGSDWRLPTQRELMLIYIFRTAFSNLGIAFSNTYLNSAYWSVTQSISRPEYYNSVNFNNGSVSAVISVGRTRCVREL